MHNYSKNMNKDKTKDIPSKDFNLQKKLCLEKLYKPDNSRKGTVDKAIIPLIEYINSLDNYYTTSSCSGRIQLLTEADSKHDVKWLLSTHSKTTYAKIDKILSSKNLKKYSKDRVWLRQENLILHVACRTIDDANRLLKITRDVGLRRGGIIADSKIIIVEICSTEKISIPVADKGKLIVSSEYIKLILKIVNQKFSKGQSRLKRLEEGIKEKLK